MLDSEIALKKERETARQLRKSRWWQNRIQNATCYYCQKNLNSDEVTMDHIVPLASGGKSTRSNAVMCCKECNVAKRDKTAVEWLLGQS